MTSEQPPKKRSRNPLSRALDLVEVVGNKLPHPATIFALLAVAAALMSWLLHAIDYEAEHPISHEMEKVTNLVSGDGFRWMYEDLTDNFVGFPPLGLVLVVMIGIGVAEGSGMFSVVIRALVLSAPKRLITFALVAAGVLSHLASEAGYVILIPLGAMIFHALGRHPMAGLAAAFVGVSGGFGSNFLVGSVDPILAGLSTSAAQIIEPEMVINPMANYYFMLISAFMVVIIGTWVTEKIVEPRLGEYKGHAERLPVTQLDETEKKGLKWAGWALLATCIGLGLTILPGGLLRNPEDDGLLHSPFLDGIVLTITIFFFFPGLAYGIAVGSIRSDKDVVKHMTTSMKTMAAYIVLVFFAAQFVAFFKESNIGLILAIQGAQGLKSIGLEGIPLIVAFVLLAAFINMFMGSASAKWAIFAQVFIPMFMIMGYHPALTQAAFRIGDSVTNLVTPMMSYFALIVTFAQKYDEKNGIGTLISMMLPFTIILTVAWILLLVGWMLIGLPVGIDAPITFDYVPAK